MNNVINNFWNGNVKLWKSYWLVGELLNALIIVIILNIEIIFFNNSLIRSQIPFFNFNDFNLLSKIFLIFWTIFITIGIWRAAEKYKGNFIWICITLILLSYRLFTLKIILFN
tara:strand:+ start:449 stop:787 length:339 start_codon:yes stop_codon:yes gene_type:complete